MQDKILRRPQVQSLIGLSCSTIYAKLADPDDEFPRPVKLGKRAVGWRESEVLAWLSERTPNAF